MEYIFYICGFVSVVSTIRVITHIEPIHALLYLITSLLAVSGVFFSLGAYFAGALEIIIYAGAILVLFVFVVMMLNLSSIVIKQEKDWLKPSMWLGPGFLSFLLFLTLLYAIFLNHDTVIPWAIIDGKQVGIKLFGPYMLAVECTSMLLVSGLVIGYHMGYKPRLPGIPLIDESLVTATTDEEQKI
ncbi:NADH-quinone oxidoreductase subunit J [Candidatus Erwinia haradaeae]|uniref:NADH-quinone oxidoreductase subunit J n=1 Tax=Candidatus Erwinia haradaeae TaxID=1922217 RepID=A0A451D960_9GAMM|nr:NADH-quinone oxidoreductase subunit J [Candidatus Erwinia haradaeae]VFP82818.1 NADH-quinone oxidoreductase subunit J [Candidatus Erwinia haradaeae]